MTSTGNTNGTNPLAILQPDRIITVNAFYFLIVLGRRELSVEQLNAAAAYLLQELSRVSVGVQVQAKKGEKEFELHVFYTVGPEGMLTKLEGVVNPRLTSAGT